MNRKAVLIMTISLVSSLALLMTPTVTATTQRAIFVGRVTNAFPAMRLARGMASACAVEPDSGRAFVFYRVPEFDWFWMWRLVEVESVSIESESMEIIGYWAVYLDLQYLGDLHYRLYVGLDYWNMEQVDDPAESEIVGTTLLYK